MPNFVRTKVDPGRLSTVAGNINNDIRQVETAIRTIKQTLSESGGGSLRGTWKGPASDQFYSQYSDDTEIFESYLQTLQKLNDQLREAAGIYDNADNRVRELVGQLKIGTR